MADSVYQGSSSLTGTEMRDGAWGTSTDPLYEQAVALVRKHNRVSISLVQRCLRIGYIRAHGLVDAMVGTVVTDMPPIGKVIRESKSPAPTSQAGPDEQED